MSTNNKANKLINEKSPYLLQHAYNPVNWYPWGVEAFEKAKKEDKPVFLSIGYSTCHWCHVMERESFADEEVARFLNENYVAIKVDREERPDIDNIYMSVCTALTGHGGWPLTILMTSEKKPFFAGTYFPKESRHGMPGFTDIIKGVKEKWTGNRAEIYDSTQKIIDFIRGAEEERDETNLSKDILHEAYRHYKLAFDVQYGGFGQAPKFPSPHNLFYLLRYYKLTGKKGALEMVEKTLDYLSRGGIYDHIGFGFARYSTDNKWLVPHFEKMLYDNALLSIAFLEAYQVTQKEKYARITEEIFTYILRDMTSPEGAFYTAEDADSQGIEGKFYVWTPEEIIEILGKEKGAIFCREYDIIPGGNFEGKSIPNLIENKGLAEDEERLAALNEWRERLFEVREKRVHPSKDDKVLTSWNALMISALALGGRILNEPKYVEAAEKAVEFIFTKLCRDDGRLLARYREGEAAYPGYVDDYAFLAWALIELYETTFKPEYLEKSIQFTGDLLRYFWDEEDGGLFFYGTDAEELITRPKEVYDGAVPAGNSVAALNFLRLEKLTGEHEWGKKASQQFEIFAGDVTRNPMAYAFFLTAFMYYVAPGKEVVIVGDSHKKDTRTMLELLQKEFSPFTATLFKGTGDGGSRLQKIAPFTEGQEMLNSKATVYICENFACRKPSNSILELEKVLKEHQGV